MIGSTLAGRYQVQSQIGIGGMGIVYQALDTRLMRHVALKVIAPHLMQQESARSRFLREAQALAGLTHPNIVTVFDLAEDESANSVFIVMELLHGHTLRQCMNELGRPPFSQVIAQVCRALELAHSRGILHRDIKPENIFVCNDGTLKLMDFGLARLLGQSSKSQSSMVAGTVSYMAPEQLKGETIDERTDLYALGILLYEYLCGHPPFEGEHPGAILLKHLTEPAPSLRIEVPEISPEIDDIILRLLEKHPEDRFPSAAALRQEFERPLSAGETTYATIADGIAIHADRDGGTAADTRVVTGIKPKQSPDALSDNRSPALSVSQTAVHPDIKPNRLNGRSTTVMSPAAAPTAASPIFAPIRRFHWKTAAALVVVASTCLGAAGMLALTYGRKHPLLANAKAGGLAIEKVHAASETLPVGASKQGSGVHVDSGDYDAPIDDNVPTTAGQASKFDEIVQENEQIVTEDERLRNKIDEMEKMIERQSVQNHDNAVHQPAGNPPPYGAEPSGGPQGDSSLRPRGRFPDPAMQRIWPHAEFDFNAWKPVRSADGSAQLNVRSASECYIYFYALMEKQNVAVLVSASTSHLPAASQRSDSTTVDLRTFGRAAPGADKIILLASVRPLRGLPATLPLPAANSDVPLDDGAAVSPIMKRFNAWHQFRDRVVNTLRVHHVQTGGRDVALDGIVLRVLRFEPLNSTDRVLDDASAFKF